jgi:hypothetical protein
MTPCVFSVYLQLLRLIRQFGGCVFPEVSYVVDVLVVAALKVISRRLMALSAHRVHHLKD